MRLFVNELCKIKASKSVKGVAVIFIFFAILAGTVWGKSDMPAALYGFGAPFMWIVANGASGFFLYALIVASLFAREFELGVIHNILGCGVKRSSYFIAKVMAVFSVTVLLYLGGICALFLFKCLLVGFGPSALIFADYGYKVLVFNGWAVCSLLSYVAVYILIACLFREAVPTFIASLVITLCELFNLFRGPVRITTDAIGFIESDKILSSDFGRLFTPCIFILVIALAAAYILFLVQDVD